ncbi:MAG: ribosome silencing factor [Sedimentisphaerales bacterium]|nr:ribosome silencing factor [Sedimentisphaerales bacterium]
MTTPKKTTEPKQDPLLASRQFACKLAQLAHDRHCTDITILELAQISPVAKHFLIATGTSEQQIRSVGNEMATLGKQENFQMFGKAGIQQGRWVVVDFVDVVVHLFENEYRRFYDLEMLWGDAPTIDWQNNQ